MPHIDLENGNAMTENKRDANATSISRKVDNNLIKHSTWSINLSTTIPLSIAYLGLYLTNYYLSPSGPRGQHRESIEGRIQPLVIILMLLGPDIIQKAFSVTAASAQNESPCFSFGWLAYSASLLVPVVSGSGDLLPRPEFDVKVVDMEAGRMIRRKGEPGFVSQTGNGKCDIDSDIVIEILKPTDPTSTPVSFWTMIRNLSMATGLFQFSLAGVFWQYYGDLSVLLLLSTSILLLEVVAKLPSLSSRNHLSHNDCREDGAFMVMRDTGSSPRRILILQPTDPEISSSHYRATIAPDAVSLVYTRASIPTVILISGGFLSQALLCTQISDAAAIAMVIVMFCGTISNVAIAALLRAPHVDGVKLQCRACS